VSEAKVHFGISRPKGVIFDEDVSLTEFYLLSLVIDF